MRLIIIILFSTFSTLCHSQNEDFDWKLRLNNCVGTFGYVYQNEHLFELGIKLDYIKTAKSGKTDGENISLITGGVINKHYKSTYLSPFITLRYLKPIKNVGIIISTNYSFRKIGSKRSNVLTPEIGINIHKVWNIKYGYNIFLDNQFSWVSKHRLALRIMLY